MSGGAQDALSSASGKAAGTEDRGRTVRPCGRSVRHGPCAAAAGVCADRGFAELISALRSPGRSVRESGAPPVRCRSCRRSRTGASVAVPFCTAALASGWTASRRPSAIPAKSNIIPAAQCPIMIFPFRPNVPSTSIKSTFHGSDACCAKTGIASPHAKTSASYSSSRPLRRAIASSAVSATPELVG